MGLMVNDSGGSGFDPLPPGTYVARCVSVIDLGVQETPWGGKEKVYLGFEVPGERVQWTDKEGVEHEGPAFIGSRYTASINDKSILGQHLTSWRGVPFTEDERKAFDLFNVLGAPCFISVVHAENNGKTYANIQSIMRLPKGTPPPDVESELVGYTPMDNQYAGNFNKLSDWQKDLVRKGFQMAEGTNLVGSANAVQQPSQATANGQAQQAGLSQREQALQAAGVPPGMPGQDHTAMAPPPPSGNDFDDDIPF